MSYLIVDASDDEILAECEFPDDVVSLMKRFQLEQPERELFVVWFGEHHGDLIGTEVLATARDLTPEEAFALYGR